MAATPLTPIAAPGCYSSPVDASGVASNVGGGGNTWVCSGNDYVILYNTTAGPLTVTITSVVDGQGRTGDITGFSIPANKVYIWGPVRQLGWAASGTGVVTITGSAVGLQLCVVRGG